MSKRYFLREDFESHRRTFRIVSRIETTMPCIIENRRVVDSKAYFVAFRTSMSIIFDEEYSLAFLLLIMYSRRSSMIAKERKIRLENIENPFSFAFFLIRMRKNDASLVPSKVIKISTQKTDSGWFIDSLTTEKVGEKILLSRGGEGSRSVSRASRTRGHSGTLSAHARCISRRRETSSDDDKVRILEHRVAV